MKWLNWHSVKVEEYSAKKKKNKEGWGVKFDEFPERYQHVLREFHSLDSEYNVLARNGETEANQLIRK